MGKLRILIIGAMDRELSGLLSFYKCRKLRQIQEVYTVWKSTRQIPFEIMVLQTFVGGNNASVSTALALSLYRPKYVFKLGCVGGASRGVHTGDVVMPLGFFCSNSWITKSYLNGEPTANASEWQSIFGTMPYQVNIENLGNQPYYFEPDNKVRDCFKSCFEGKDWKPTSCYIGSGNIWSFDSKYTKNVSFAQIPGEKRNRVWVADMESYAVAQACHVFGVPFMGFYRVSDNYFEGEEYVPEKVASLFDLNFITTIDEFLRGLVSEI